MIQSLNANGNSLTRTAKINQVILCQATRQLLIRRSNKR